MPTDINGSSSPANFDDHQIFSILRSKNPENQLNECVTNAVTRGAFTEFAQRHPHLVESSPLLNKASIRAKELEISENNFSPAPILGLNYLAAKIHGWIYGRFSKDTQDLESIILTEPNRLADYVRKHPLSKADATLINAYLESGTLRQKHAIDPFLTTPGVIIKLLSAGKVPVPWFAELIQNRSDKLKHILSLTQLNSLSMGEQQELFKPFLKHLEVLYDTQPELAIELLSKRNGDGKSHLDSSWLHLPLCEWLQSNEKSRPELVCRVLGIRLEKGQNLLMKHGAYIENMKDLLYRLSSVIPQEVTKLLGMQDDLGNTVIMMMEPYEKFSFRLLAGSTTRLVALSHIIQKLIQTHPQGVLDLMKKQNAWGETSMMMNLEGTVPLLASLAEKSPAEVRDLFLIKDENGESAISKLCENFYLEDTKTKLELLDNIINLFALNSAQTAVEFIDAILKDTHDLVTSRSFWTIISPHLEEMASIDPKLVANILMHKDDSGKIVLDKRSNILKLRPIIKILLKDAEVRTLIQEFLLTKDKNGNTLFHAKPDNLTIETALIEIVEACGIDLDTLKNKYNFTPLNSAVLSEEWLRQLKDLTPVPGLTEEEYAARVEEMKTYILSEWDAFDFGYGPGQLNPHDLDVHNNFNATDAAGRRIPIDQEAIKVLKGAVGNALKEMLNRIENKTPFLMTPRADNPKGLLRFYTRLLISVETIVESMKAGDRDEAKKIKNTDYKAGTLVTAARTQIDERCGTAYRRELASLANVCSPKKENLSMEEMIREAANTALEETINTIVGEKYNGDVHYLQQYLFAAGLESEGDHLPNISVEEARESIIKEGDFYRFLDNFASSDAIDSDILAEYLKSQTPVDFDEGYLEAIRLAKKMENEALFKAKSILSKAFPRDARPVAMNLLIGMKGPSLLAGVTAPEFAASGNFLESSYATALVELNSQLEKLNIVLPEMPKIPSNINSNSLGDIETVLKNNARKQIVPLEMNRLRMAYSAIQNWRQTLQRSADFERDMRLKGFTSAKQFAAMIQAKETLIDDLNKIPKEIENTQPYASALNLSYEARNGSLPSQIFDYTRRLEYNKEVIGSEPLTMIEVLFVLGVLQQQIYDVDYED